MTDQIGRIAHLALGTPAELAVDVVHLLLGRRVEHREVSVVHLGDSQFDGVALGLQQGQPRRGIWVRVAW